MTRLLATVLAFSIALLPARANAQDTAPPAAPPTAAPSAAFQLPDVGDFLPLHRGTAAPRDGLLVDQAEMLSIVQGYDRLQHLLDATVTRDGESCDVRVAIEHAHTVASEERVSLRDALWTDRQAELVAQIQAVQVQLVQAQHAAERQWWELPVLWFFVGVAVAAAVVVAVIVR